jgi:hypothetical protein
MPMKEITLNVEDGHILLQHENEMSKNDTMEIVARRFIRELTRTKQGRKKLKGIFVLCDAIKVDMEG